MMDANKGYTPYGGISLVVIPIVIGLTYLIYLIKDAPTVIIQERDKTIDSLTYEISHLEPLRDTIVQEVIRTQVKWKERLVEAYSKPETVRVLSYVPIRLDSCLEVGMMLKEQIAITDSLLLTYRRKDTAMVKAIATRDSLVLVCQGERARNEKAERLYRFAAIAGIALFTGLIIAK